MEDKTQASRFVVAMKDYYQAYDLFAYIKPGIVFLVTLLILTVHFTVPKPQKVDTQQEEIDIQVDPQRPKERANNHSVLGPEPFQVNTELLSRDRRNWNTLAPEKEEFIYVKMLRQFESFVSPSDRDRMVSGFYLVISFLVGVLLVYSLGHAIASVAAVVFDVYMRKAFRLFVMEWLGLLWIHDEPSVSNDRINAFLANPAHDKLQFKKEKAYRAEVERAKDRITTPALL